MKKRIDFYAVSIHIALVGLCAAVVFLVQENQRLKDLLNPPPSGPDIGQSVEPILWQPLDGEESTLNFAAAGHESLLLVFTTDCPACWENQRAWRALYKELGTAVDIVGISLSELEATRGYQEVHDIPFPVGVLAQPEEFIASLTITGVPMTIRVGSDGRVRGSWSGTLSASQLSELSLIRRG